MSFVPCRLRLCPAPLMSPFGPSCPEPLKAKLNRAWPRGPRCPPALRAPPLLLPSLLPPVPPTLVVSSFAIFFFTASPLLPLVDFSMSFAPCRLRVCLAPLSPFGPRCSVPRKTKVSLVPGPGVPVPPPPPPAQPPPSGEGAATSKRPSLMRGSPALPPTTTRCCSPLCRRTRNPPPYLMVLDELQGKATARHKEGVEKGGKS
jgi:hypothetical protein